MNLPSANRRSALREAAAGQRRAARPHHSHGCGVAMLPASISVRAMERVTQTDQHHPTLTAIRVSVGPARSHRGTAARQLTCIPYQGWCERAWPAPPKLPPSRAVASVPVRSWHSAPTLYRRPQIADTRRRSTWCPIRSPDPQSSYTGYRGWSSAAGIVRRAIGRRSR